MHWSLTYDGHTPEHQTWIKSDQRLEHYWEDIHTYRHSIWNTLFHIQEGSKRVNTRMWKSEDSLSSPSQYFLIYSYLIIKTKKLIKSSLRIQTEHLLITSLKFHLQNNLYGNRNINLNFTIISMTLIKTHILGHRFLPLTDSEFFIIIN
jgi:hypothetical protein